LQYEEHVKHISFTECNAVNTSVKTVTLREILHIYGRFYGIITLREILHIYGRFFCIIFTYEKNCKLLGMAYR